MMENRFENAYFGKPYKTRDGHRALFHRNANDKIWYLFTEDIHERIPYNADGTCRGDDCHDIISEWQEEISDEELEELAEEFIQGFDHAIEISPNQLSLKKDRALAKSVFKAGCHKALEYLIKNKK